MLQYAYSEKGGTLCWQGVYEDSTSYLILYEPKIVFKFFINRAEDLVQLVQCLPSMQEALSSVSRTA